MKTIIVTAVSILLVGLLSVPANAQVFEQGTKLRDLGFQAQKLYKSGAFTFEKGVAQDVGIGGRIAGGYWDLGESTQAALQLTGAYHFGRFLDLPKDNLDLFAGIGFGAILTTDPVSDVFISFLSTPNAGVRYFISDRFGFFGRFAVDIYKDTYKVDTGFGGGKISKLYRTPSFTIGIAFRK